MGPVASQVTGNTATRTVSCADRPAPALLSRRGFCVLSPPLRPTSGLRTASRCCQTGSVGTAQLSVLWLLLSCPGVSDSATPWTAAHQAPPSFTSSRFEFELELAQTMSTESAMPSNHLNFCCPLLLLPSIFPSIRVFSNELFLHIRWPKDWSSSISLSNEYSRLISFTMDWLDLAVQGTLRSLLQHHSSKGSIIWHSAFFMIQLSHPYMTAGKTIALTRRTFVSKIMSLLFNMLSRSVIVFLPRSQCILISWLQSPSAVISEPKEIKSLTVSIVSPSICHEVMGLDALILVF